MSALGQLPAVSLALFAVALAGFLLIWVFLFAVRKVRRQRLRPPERFPSISLIKPLCGRDDGLEENLRSHAELDYPGPLEILLGLRSEADLAFPAAKACAERYPERVRVVLQEGEPGHNPKVNQLITLTRAARHEVLVCTDSNIRVPPHYLREIVAVLEKPGVGLATNLFVGVGERRLGALFDNMTLATFCAPPLAAGTLWPRANQVVGKSLALRKEVLAEVGGWHAVKDVLAEDQRLGDALRRAGYRSAFCPSPVLNVQEDQTIGAFWRRHTRWAMIRFRVIFPGALLEPVLNPFALALIAYLCAPWSRLALGLCGAAALLSIATTQIAARLERGHGFSLAQLPWVPVRDLLLLLAWIRGGTLREVNWRGNTLRVIAQTRLVEREAIIRAKNIARLR